MTNYTLLEKHNLKSNQAVTLFLIDRMVMADGQKTKEVIGAFVQIAINHPELVVEIPQKKKKETMTG